MTSKRVKKEALADADIVAEILKGNEKNFEILVQRYHDKLFFYLRHMVRSKEESEDLLQGVFLKVYEKIRTFDTKRQFSSWIYRIAHNEAVNLIKRKGRRRFVSWEDIVSVKDKMETASDDKSPQEAWVNKEIRREVRDAMRQIPKKYREVLILRFYFDKTYEEISEIIGKPKNTVGTLINRAKKKLVRLLNDKDII